MVGWVVLWELGALWKVERLGELLWLVGWYYGSWGHCGKLRGSVDH